MSYDKPSAEIRRAQNTAKMKTWATGDCLTMDDLLRHAHTHRGFHPGHMAQWLDENPARWYRYRNVADANHARKQAMRGGR